ncbi:RES domain-containing protein [Xanthomonas euvesicatoria pv. eucalypti]|uniref:RES domain-containing protein n=1 Tax=Xanthomonas euvesicatoria TaxID=456327 RepID=UPI0026E33EEC|nr:RES domain-containing protein [Xanthomonas euvesicatoria]MDO7931546.1 RES domain-containing protein [Xanthomonas euvesicatoria pv. eucalypti]MDO7935727.1 RES domain-containing protein [Xanthomonas euvesicatoria pv. eucalypti]MDO7940073.1 RES domain-containing protein [Xanthomonas euvesicatoria pv. eucalypti]MDO7944574.1 RES domain-containing protein [Xanthomonas euvesicatoria pv. eucalypti]MDO7951976.1 RES domain-containing protein [Xanthomonas euvesicatoria pv. eucalypti]
MAPPLDWFANNTPPKRFPAPVGMELYRVVERSPHWGPLDANPYSKARFALRDGHHGMFYVADRIEGALWEALLRYAVFTPGRPLHLPTAKLRGQRLATVRLRTADVGVLRLYAPAVHQLFGDEHHPASVRILELLTTTNHGESHAEAGAMLAGLNGLDPPIPHMPILQWKSKQFPDANVYLAYDPPLGAADWELVDDVPLDDADGHARIRAALAQEGYDWTPMALGATAISELPAADPE